jgi:Sulfotransferase family
MLPNFIVIGAAKAGTTALYWYLAEHPAVFMSEVKETNFFAYGVDGHGRLIYGDPDVHKFPVKTLAEYEALFADPGGAQAVGEASPIYLECPQAPGRIRALLPDVRLVCCLRHPVERAYADYLMYLWRRGRRFEPARDLTPDAVWARPDSRWMDVSRYHAQLARYYEIFPRDRIHVFLFDDLKRSTVDAVQGVYRFLAIDSAFVPDLETAHNVGGVPASRALESFLTNRSLRAVVEPWIPKRAADWVRRIRTSNMRKAPPLPPELRKELTSRFREDIVRTSGLIGRSLDHWL